MLVQQGVKSPSTDIKQQCKEEEKTGHPFLPVRVIHCFPVHTLHSTNIQELAFHFRERQFVYPRTVNNRVHLAVTVKGCSVMTANRVFQLCI